MLAERYKRFIRRKSNGELVKLVLGKVDRIAGEVTIKVPKYNTALTFEKGFTRTGKEFAVLTENGRQPIDPRKPEELTELHLTNSVYWGAAQWAHEILRAPREIKIPEVQERRW